MVGAASIERQSTIAVSELLNSAKSIADPLRAILLNSTIFLLRFSNDTLYIVVSDKSGEITMISATPSKAGAVNNTCCASSAFAYVNTGAAAASTSIT